jgi:hypothetical protein
VEKSVKVYGKSGKAPHILLPIFPEKKKTFFARPGMAKTAVLFLYCLFIFDLF